VDVLRLGIRTLYQDSIMITKEMKSKLIVTGMDIGSKIGDFYGKISFNYYNGKYVCTNIEHTIKPDKLKK